MKLLLVAPMAKTIGPVGGVGSVTENMIHYLHKKQNDIDLTYYNTVHSIRSLTTKSLLIRIATGVSNSLGTFIRVFWLIIRNKPDVIHLSSSSSFALFKDYLIVLAANFFKTPIVMHWHFGRVPALAIKKNWEWKLFTRIIRRCTISVVLDKSTQNTLNQAGFLNVVCIPNPLSPDIEQKARELPAKPINRIPNRLIYVGHVIKTKGVYELVEACSQISSVHELILIGSYEENVKRDLIEIVSKREEGRWLNLAGPQYGNRLFDFMYNSPILILPSYTEGFPMVILEAMALGCAIIASDVGAIPEMLAFTTTAPCGICVPPQNVEKLKDAIIALVNDPLMIESMGKRGNERVLNHYTPEIVIREYINTWKNAAGKRFDA